MRNGVVLPNMGVCADAALVADLGREAERAGWDGVFVWDALNHPIDDPRNQATCDGWVALGLLAAATDRVTIGTMITPLSRRRPWKVARETTTVDHLSKGRLVLPVGLGAVDDHGFAKVGEETDRRKRAQRLDEALAILQGCWGGAPFSFQGEHFRVEETTFLPPSYQRPRVPVWVVAVWPRRPRSMARALRWDGIIPTFAPPGAERARDPRPEEIAAIRAEVSETTGDRRYDYVVEISTKERSDAEAADLAAAYADAGTTWWLEPVWERFYEHPGEVEPMRERIQQGPPAR
jgi:alkanesulfonate monooxygenase SsuD/methylene tetrahydromethanopterin reductase-like flavin-dependent oxidoreductase (luciferase family)